MSAARTPSTAPLPAWLRALALLLALAGGACASLSPAEHARVGAIIAAAQPATVECDRPDACARASSLHALGARALGASAPDAPRHYALLLDYGQDAFVARLDLFRSATRSIDVQTYIFDEDDAGRLTLHELLAAARRGVKVRLLIDQLSALRRVDTLAALATAHANFQVRIYNPVLGRARIGYPQYVLAAACCWNKLNQRMHSKMLVVDGQVAVTGGRNYQDDYFDWSDEYNFRDRDVLVAGPEVHAMQANFDAFWDNRRAVPIERLSDVGGYLLRHGALAQDIARYERPARVEAISREADDVPLVDGLAGAAWPVGQVEFVGDLPEKHRQVDDRGARASRGLLGLVESAREQVLLQTPYLVLSDEAQAMFRALRRRPDRPQVAISTNSLAATDSFITYALAYKYKRRYLRDFGFDIYEFKPFPEDAPIDVDATGAVAIAWRADGTPLLDGVPVDLLPAQHPDPPDAPLAPAVAGSGGGTVARGGEPGTGRMPAREPSAARGAPRPLTREYSALRFAGIDVNERVPLKRAGVRVGLHAKSMVIDDRIGVVGTHNFDPRGDHYNTESAVVVDDAGFAGALARSIRRDMAPGNAWTIARRDKPVVFSGLEYSLAKVSERLPVFDLWPTRYATSYQFQPGPACPEPLPPNAPGFRACYEPVGDFPEVDIGLRMLLTRIFTAFGAGLAPIL